MRVEELDRVGKIIGFQDDCCIHSNNILKNKDINSDNFLKNKDISIVCQLDSKNFLMLEVVIFKCINKKLYQLLKRLKKIKGVI